MTLTSDNTLRLFNLDLEQEKAEETIRLSEGTYFFLFSNHNVQILDLSHLTIFFSRLSRTGPVW